MFGALNVTRAALPQLRRRRSGHIVQISSLEGIAHLGIKVTIVEPGPLRTDFAAGAVARPPHSGDYADSVGKALEWFEGLSGRQPNDPSRVAAAIIEAVTSAEPPLRLALGTEAVQAIRESSAVSGGTWMPGNASVPPRP